MRRMTCRHDDMLACCCTLNKHVALLAFKSALPPCHENMSTPALPSPLPSTLPLPLPPVDHHVRFALTASQEAAAARHETQRARPPLRRLLRLDVEEADDEEGRDKGRDEDRAGDGTGETKTAESKTDAWHWGWEWGAVILVCACIGALLVLFVHSAAFSLSSSSTESSLGSPPTGRVADRVAAGAATLGPGT
jgi:hypothetical protein